MAISTQTEALLDLYNQKLSLDTQQLSQISTVQSGYTITTGIGASDQIKIWGPTDVIENYTPPIQKLDNRIIEINQQIVALEQQVLSIGQAANAVGCGSTAFDSFWELLFPSEIVYEDQLNYRGYTFTAPNPFSAIGGSLINGNFGIGSTDTQIYNTIGGVNSNLLSVDVYGLTGKFNPVVIYIHGGAWAIGDKANIDSKATFFNNLGYVFVSVNYRLSPPSNVNVLREYSNFVGDDGTEATASTRVKHSNHVSDCARAVTWVYNNISSYGGDRHKLILIGHSAGGHLASLLATNQSYLTTAGLPSGKVIGCISIDTEGYDIYKQITNPVSGGQFDSQQQKVYQNAFGIYPDSTVTGTGTTITTDFATTTAAQSSYTTASPISNINSSTPPFLVFRRGTSDRITRETEFVTALQSAGRTVTAVSYPDSTTYTHSEINQSIGAENDPPLGKSLPSGVPNVTTQIQNWITSIAPVKESIGLGTQTYVNPVAIGSYFGPISGCNSPFFGCDSGVCAGYATSINNLNTTIVGLQSSRDALIQKVTFLKAGRSQYELQNYGLEQSKVQINTAINVSSTIVGFLQDPANEEWL